MTLGQSKLQIKLKKWENILPPFLVFITVASAIFMSNLFVNDLIIQPILIESKTITPFSQTAILGVISTSTATLAALPKSKSNIQPNATKSATTKKAPQARSKTPLKLGFVVSNYTNSTGELSSLTTKIGHKIDTVGIYKQFGLLANSAFNSNDLQYVKDNGQELLLTWEPWNPEQGKKQTVDYLQSIISGQMDSYITQFALAIKSYGAPVTLRFGHEMNGDWYPWGNRASEYVTAYRHLVDLFRREAVSNVQWVWSINSDNVPYTPIKSVSQFYPGDNYVDLIGIDGFNFGNDNNGFRSFSTIYQPSYSFITATYRKPIVISEIACAEEGGDKGQWVKDMFQVLAKKFPKVTGIVWFNLLKERDWRVDSTPSSLQAFQQALKSKAN